MDAINMKNIIIIPLFFCFGVCKGQSYKILIGKNELGDSVRLEKAIDSLPMCFKVWDQKITAMQLDVEDSHKLHYILADSVWLKKGSKCFYFRYLIEKDEDIKPFVHYLNKGTATQMNGNQVKIIDTVINGKQGYVFTVDSILPNGKLYDPSKYDTVKVLCQVSDTAVVLLDSEWSTIDPIQKYYYKRQVEWQYLYSVREKHNTNEGVNDAAGQICIGGNGEIVPCFSDYWKHLYYLDAEMKPLSKNIIVWESIEVK